MKEITRIHIAKTAYDIELTAKKELEKYINALERYAEDPEILQDIEIRITELLQENGTTKDDVITTDDVTKLRERLGEPQDFAEDSEVATLPADADAKPRRRLYRDGDKAVLGGVLAGIATYFGINPLWTRLIFIVLLIGSFGTMAIVYIVLWIALPPARTAAEKLELEGKKVTLAAIKERSEKLVESVNANQTARTVQKVLLFCLGLFLSVMAVGALIAVVTASIFAFSTDEQMWHEIRQLTDTAWLFWVAYGLFVVSGLLFAALNAVLATAAFARTWTKRIGTAVVVIVVSGIVAFSGGIGTMLYGSWQANENYRQSMTVTNQQLNAKFAQTKKIAIDVTNAPSFGSPTVVYIVSGGKPRVELSHVKGKMPQFDVLQDGETAKITIKQTLHLHWQADAPIRVYGPALDEFTVHGGVAKYTNDKKQGSLSLISTDNASLYTEGTFETIKARTSGNSSIDLDDATVRTLDATTDSGTIEAGIVRTLTATQPEACSSSAENSGESVIEVEGVSSGTVTHNGTERTVKTDDKIGTPCGIVTVGDGEEEDY